MQNYITKKAGKQRQQNAKLETERKKKARKERLNRRAEEELETKRKAMESGESKPGTHRSNKKKDSKKSPSSKEDEKAKRQSKSRSKASKPVAVKASSSRPSDSKEMPTTRANRTPSDDDHVQQDSAIMGLEPQALPVEDNDEENEKQASNEASADATQGGIATASTSQGTPEIASGGNGGRDRSSRRCDRKAMGALALCLVLALVLALFFGGVFKSDTDQVSPSPQEPVVSVPTNKAEPQGTTAPTGSPTDGSLLLYQPPTCDDCTAIERGNDVSNQTGLIVQNFEVEIDVVLANYVDPNVWLNEPDGLEDKIQGTLMPSIAGCTETCGFGRRNLRAIEASRKLAAAKHVVVNARAQATYDSTKSCKSDAGQGFCYRITVSVDLYLKSDEPSFKLVSIISEVFEGGSLLETLGLESQFQKIDFVDAKFVDPTNVPSITPSAEPSISPSNAPSKDASSSPSRDPTSNPSMSPSAVASLAPTFTATTMAPSFAPTPGPTLDPTPGPTPDPTPGPTPDPTPGPTPDPTPGPTQEPSPGSTPDPTPGPTPGPTPVPTPDPKQPYLSSVLEADLGPFTAGCTKVAFEWLVSDTWTTSAANAVTLWRERYIMALFYCKTNGDGWTTNTDWLTSKPVCEWVQYSSIGKCDGNGEMTMLWLYQNGLTGNIPSELGMLTGLTRLHLGDNGLTGNIPSELGMLTSLTLLDLSGNELTGNIPSELGMLTGLTSLWLHVNQLSGSIPLGLVGVSCYLAHQPVGFDEKNCFDSASLSNAGVCDVSANCI